jgi:hypothetical protein
MAVDIVGYGCLGVSATSVDGFTESTRHSGQRFRGHFEVISLRVRDCGELKEMMYFYILETKVVYVRILLTLLLF